VQKVETLTYDSSYAVDVVFVVGTAVVSTSGSGETPEKADDDPGFPAMYGVDQGDKISQAHCLHRSTSM
jgi:hypothetical protein